MPRSTVRITVSWIGLAIAGALCFGPAPVRAADEPAAQFADLTYDVYLGGLHIFTFDVSLALRPDGYRVTAEGGTRGAIGWLYAWETSLAAEGVDRDGAIAPRRYLVDSIWQGSRRTLDLGFAADGRFELRQVPPPEPDPDIEGELPESLPEGTFDPLSLGLAAGRTLQETSRCDQTVPVFDGRRRFDLTLSHIDEAILPPNDYAIYEGPAVRCSLDVRRISGFRKSWRSNRSADAPTPPTIWVAAVRPGLPPVPVRYDGAIALGNIVIHLTGATVRTEEASRPE